MRQTLWILIFNSLHHISSPTSNAQTSDLLPVFGTVDWSQFEYRAKCEYCGPAAIRCDENMCITEYPSMKPPSVEKRCQPGYGVSHRFKSEENGTTIVAYECEPCTLRCQYKRMGCLDRLNSICMCNEEFMLPGELKSRCRLCDRQFRDSNCSEVCEHCGPEAICESDGSCECSPYKPECERCPKGKKGQHCEESCAFDCLPDANVVCLKQGCAKKQPTEGRYCAYHHGYTAVRTVDGSTVAACERCRLAKLYNQTLECTEQDVAMPSCSSYDYKNGEAPDDCLKYICAAGQSGENCETPCRCGPEARCNSYGECFCTSGKDVCQRCPTGFYGEKCEKKCNTECMHDKDVSCEDIYCYYNRHRQHFTKRVCAIGYGTVTMLQRSGITYHECKQCFNGHSPCVHPNILCKHGNYSECSCQNYDYLPPRPSSASQQKENIFGERLTNCKLCPTGKWGLGNCSMSCNCGPDATCGDEDGRCFCTLNKGCQICASGFDKLWRIDKYHHGYYVCDPHTREVIAFEAVALSKMWMFIICFSILSIIIIGLSIAYLIYNCRHPIQQQSLTFTTVRPTVRISDESRKPKKPKSPPERTLRTVLSAIL